MPLVLSTEQRSVKLFSKVSGARQLQCPLCSPPPGRMLLQKGTQPLTFPPRCLKGNPSEASSPQAAHPQCERHWKFGAGFGFYGNLQNGFHLILLLKIKFYKDRSMSICISIVLLLDLQAMTPSSQ